jgi:hypothetical protein
MYPEASIKLCSPKKSYQTRVKTANEVGWKFNKRFTQDIGAMNRGTLSDPLFIGSLRRPPMKKEAGRKTQRGSPKRPPIKKRGTPKNAKGLVQKTSDEKRGAPQNAKELLQKATV